VDGRQVAAALVLGAQGVVVGTALAVAEESTLPAYKKQAILNAGSQAAPPGRSRLCLSSSCFLSRTLCRAIQYMTAQHVPSAFRCHGPDPGVRPAGPARHMAAWDGRKGHPQQLH